jgi:membrane protein DedA with SNARE-associated domain
MLHSLIALWFTWVRDGGYWGVFFLMALESTIVPVPSELVMPPAAFWAAQGAMNFWGVVAAGTLGSYFGSAISYWFCYALGRPFLDKYGRFFRLKPKQLLAMEQMILRFGAPAIFIARLMPVVRHLISLPAGIFRMKFSTFSFVTLTGAGLWCYILSAWGQKVIGAHPDLINSPADMMRVIRAEMFWLVAGVAVLAVLYGVFIIYQRKLSQPKN